MELRSKKRNTCPNLVSNFYFRTRFSSGDGRRSSSLETLHIFEQLLIVLLAPNQSATKPGRGIDHATWSLVGIWRVLLWLNQQDEGRTSPTFLGASWPRGRAIVAEISLPQ